MRLNHGRNKLFAGLAGGAGLLIAIALTIRPAAVYAQEDESFSETPAAGDGTGATWEAAPDFDDSSDQVLELPQVVAVHHGDDAANPMDATADAADSADPMADASASSDPTADPASQVGNLDDYADQDGAAGLAVARATLSMPGPPFSVAAPAETTLPPPPIVGTNWAPAGFVPYARGFVPNARGFIPFIVARPFGYARIPATSPMLSVPRGSHVMMGGWWQHGHR
jgi:hypothetical protein